MDKGENPVQSVSFSWSSLAYPVRWAEKPEEVPHWDVSRGCPLWFKEGRPSAPEINWLGTHENGTWELKDAPLTGYPRLVRAHFDKEAKQGWHDNEDILNELVPLYEYVEPWRQGKPVAKLKSDVLKLAERYGPPGAEDENTLDAWLGLSATVRTHLWAYKILCESGYEALIGEIDAWVEQFVKMPSRSKDASSLGIMHSSEAFTLSLLHIWNTQLNIEQRYRKQPRSKSMSAVYRRQVSERLYPAFDDDLVTGRIKSRLVAYPSGVVALCPVTVWVSYRLSQLWRHGAEVRACPVCGTLFAPTRSNMKYCRRGTCAFKAHKQNQKARAARGDP